MATRKRMLHSTGSEMALAETSGAEERPAGSSGNDAGIANDGTSDPSMLLLPDVSSSPITYEQACDSNTELWLLRIPPHQVLRSGLVGKEIDLEDPGSSSSVHRSYGFSDRGLSRTARTARAAFASIVDGELAYRIGPSFVRQVDVVYSGSEIENVTDGPPEKVYPSVAGDLSAKFRPIGSHALFLSCEQKKGQNKNVMRKAAELSVVQSAEDSPSTVNGPVQNAATDTTGRQLPDSLDSARKTVPQTPRLAPGQVELDSSRARRRSHKRKSDVKEFLKTSVEPHAAQLEVSSGVEKKASAENDTELEITKSDSADNAEKSKSRSSTSVSQKNPSERKSGRKRHKERREGRESREKPSKKARTEFIPPKREAEVMKVLTGAPSEVSPDKDRDAIPENIRAELKPQGLDVSQTLQEESPKSVRRKKEKRKARKDKKMGRL